VFRYGVVERADSKVFFYRDGKTASVAVRRQRDSTVGIITNGKPDATIQMDPDLEPSGDEYTMAVAAALPLLMKPDARTYANIGWSIPRRRSSAGAAGGPIGIAGHSVRHAHSDARTAPSAWRNNIVYGRKGPARYGKR
jgi:hypothetical protein